MCVCVCASVQALSILGRRQTYGGFALHFQAQATVDLFDGRVALFKVALDLFEAAAVLARGGVARLFAIACRPRGAWREGVMCVWGGGGGERVGG